MLIDLMDIVLVAGLILMFAGYYYRTRVRHGVVLAGYVIYSLYWLVWTFLYFTVKDNPSNGLFTVAGILVFGYLGYHEYVNYRKDQYITAMEWGAKGTAVTALSYLIIERVHQVGGYIVYATAWQTGKILNWIGYEPDGFPVRLGPLLYDGPQGPSVLLIGSGIATHEISIILACTGIQAMILFLAFNVLLRAERRRKIYAFLMTVPVIYVANQFRNVAIIYLKNEEIDFGTGMDPFDLAHHWLGKIFSFLVLIGIVIYTFRVLPEALDNLFTLMDLHKRDEGKIEGGKLVLPPRDDGKGAGDGGEGDEGGDGDTQVGELEGEGGGDGGSGGSE